ncbi:MAG: DUF2817 domain-containing protein [Pseudomonadales bacterium]|nr:DUF2817 domain-containing protein [Pseudomonadales bacterium]
MHQYFSRSYAEARRIFLQQCEATAATLEHIQHPLSGPDGDIYMDVAIWGERQCEHMLIVSSATHGIEGYAGSGLQSLLLAEDLPNQLPENTTLLMIHGVNPHGFAWQRRVTEDNVDLNRNFLDHSIPPENPEYLEIAEILEPNEWHQDTEASIREQLSHFSQKHGARWLQGAMTKGQYTHENGFFYGGKEPTWSNLKLHELGRRYINHARMATMVDIHTALGQFGEAECITTYPMTSDEYKRCRSLWGMRVQTTDTGDSVSVDVNGPMVNAMQQYSDALGTGLEFGTHAVSEVTMALIADQWLHQHADFNFAAGHPVKERMMEAFYPDSDKWRESIAGITREILNQSLSRTS